MSVRKGTRRGDGVQDKHVALLIAMLALFLALAEAGGKNAEHRSTEQNIEASDLFNFYQARKIRQSMVETSSNNSRLPPRRSRTKRPRASSRSSSRIGRPISPTTKRI